MLLCYCRMMYIEFTVSQSMEHFLGCHQNAFDWFGAVPGEVMVDNLKSGLLKRIVGKDHIFNPKYLDFANKHGFTIVPCPIGKVNEKGHVESGVGNVKKNFLAGLYIPDFSTLKPAVIHWLNTVANVRVHGETGKRPVDRFQRERQSMTDCCITLKLLSSKGKVIG
jgi:transposase